MEEFTKKYAHFQMNLDEECVIMGFDGIVKVIVLIFRKILQ